MGLKGVRFMEVKLENAEEEDSRAVPPSYQVPRLFKASTRRDVASDALLNGDTELWLVRLPDAQQVPLQQLAGVEWKVKWEVLEGQGSAVTELGRFSLSDGSEQRMVVERLPDGALFGVVPTSELGPGAVKRIVRGAACVVAEESAATRAAEGPGATDAAEECPSEDRPGAGGPSGGGAEPGTPSAGGAREGAAGGMSSEEPDRKKKKKKKNNGLQAAAEAQPPVGLEAGTKTMAAVSLSEPAGDMGTKKAKKRKQSEGAAGAAQRETPSETPPRREAPEEPPVGPTPNSRDGDHIKPKKKKQKDTGSGREV